MSDQCHCPEQGLDESCGMCRFEQENDSLKAELEKYKADNSALRLEGERMANQLRLLIIFPHVISKDCLCKIQEALDAHNKLVEGK